MPVANAQKTAEEALFTRLSALTKQPGTWPAHIGEVAAALGHPSARIRAKALWLLGEMGLRHPETAAPFVPQVAALLTGDDAKVRERAVGALGRIGRGRFDAVAPHLAALMQTAQDEAPLVRMNFVWAAENISINHPTAFAGEMGLFARLLDDEHPRVRIEAPEIFRVVGKRQPNLVRPYLPKLRQMAQHHPERVVRIHCAGAVRATEDAEAETP